MDAVLIFLAIATLWRGSAAGYFFTAMVIGFRWVFDGLDGMLYYPTAALFDVGAMLLLHYVSPMSRRAYRLIWVSGAWMCINLFGWIMWAFYQDPTLYNVLSLIVCALAVAIVAEDNNVGMDRVVVNRTGVDSDSVTRREHTAQGGESV